jgi:two-component system OmpR family response regulator
MPDSSARVLVVDDEPNITDLVALALRYEGFSVEKASTGRAALSAVQKFKPDLVILDVMLPDVSGLDVMKRLSAEGRKVPVIFLTARDSTEDKVHGLTIGGDDYVTKPFSIEELVARVRVVLRRNGSSTSSRIALADLELDQAHRQRADGQQHDQTGGDKARVPARLGLVPAQLHPTAWLYHPGISTARRPEKRVMTTAVMGTRTAVVTTPLRRSGAAARTDTWARPRESARPRSTMP